MGIYKNVACIFLSKDDQGDVWIHLGVELRGQGYNRKPHLSTFGGVIDKTDETLIAALQREVSEEGLGLLDGYMSSQSLANPDKTYSFAYTDLATLQKTVVFAVLISHEEIEKIKTEFISERNERMYKRNNKKFKNRAETEVKEIRSVRLEHIKAYISQNNNNALLQTNSPATSFLSIDRQTVKKDNNGLLLYDIWMVENKPVETPIPSALPMRWEILNSFTKVMSGIEFRFFDKPIIAEACLENQFYGKAINADELCSIGEFIDNLPIKGLEKRGKHSSKQKGPRKEFTARGTEIIDLELKKNYGIGKQYTQEQKSSYSNLQSVSYFFVKENTPALGLSNDSEARLIGVADFDLLPNRLFVYKSSTEKRPYDGSLKQVEEFLRLQDFYYDISELESFKAKIQEIGSNGCNEILGRIRWNIASSSVCVFSDNLESRWLAISCAKKIESRIKQQSGILYQQELISKEGYATFQEYQAIISYYFFNENKRGFYSQEEIEADINYAQVIFNNLELRQEAIKNEQYEIFLLINDKEQLEQIVSDHILMKNILNTRAYIALDITERYNCLTALKPINKITFFNPEANEDPNTLSKPVIITNFKK